MTIQEQLHYAQVNDESLSFLKAIGVDYLTINPSMDMRDGKDRRMYWADMRDLAAAHGLILQNAASACWDEITLALERRPPPLGIAVLGSRACRRRLPGRG